MNKTVAKLFLHELLQFQVRNEISDNEDCVSVALEYILRGFGYVVWKLIQDPKVDPDRNFEFNDKQILCIAFLIWSLKQAWRMICEAYKTHM